MWWLVGRWLASQSNVKNVNEQVQNELNRDPRSMQILNQKYLKSSIYDEILKIHTHTHLLLPSPFFYP